jgi:hypothetical protein
VITPNSFQERGGGSSTTRLDKTVLLAFVRARPQVARTWWYDHGSNASGSHQAVDSAIFEVIEGDGDFLLIHEANGDRPTMIASSIADFFGEHNLIDCTRFVRVFSDNTARCFSQVTRFLFLARANVDDTLDHVGFNHWYDTTHVPEVSQVGLRRAQRFRSSTDRNDYLASYEIAALAVLTSDELAQVRGFHQFTPKIQQLRRTVARPIWNRKD